MRYSRLSGVVELSGLLSLSPQASLAIMDAAERESNEGRAPAAAKPGDGKDMAGLPTSMEAQLRIDMA
jgi:hypothetical protein